MKIIAISGKAGSGKTALLNNLKAALLMDKHNSKVNVVRGLKFADPLYKAQESIQESLFKESKKDRELLIKVGDLLKSHYEEKALTTAMLHRLKNHCNIEDYIIIDDLRYTHELYMLYSNFDVFTIRLEASVEILDKRVKVPANRSHFSETDLDSEKFDLIIDVERNTEMEVVSIVLNELGYE